MNLTSQAVAKYDSCDSRFSLKSLKKLRGSENKNRTCRTPGRGFRNTQGSHDKFKSHQVTSFSSHPKLPI